MRMKIRKIWLLAFMIVFSSSTVLADDKLPLDAFAMLPTIKQVRVSPDGKKLGVIRSVNKAGFYFLDIYDTDNIQKDPQSFGGGRMEITRLDWVNDTKIVLGLRQKVKSGNKESWVNRSIVVDVKTGKMGKMIGFKNYSSTGSNLKDLNNDARVFALLPKDKNNRGCPR